MIGSGAVTWVATATFASSGAAGASASMLTVTRARAGIVTDRVTATPDCGRNVSTAVTGLAFGLASSTNVSKNGPVAPSARNQLLAGAVTPAELWPPLKSTSGGAPKYIVR